MKNNVIYWFIGNIITIGIGIYFLILDILMKKSCLENFSVFLTFDLFRNVLFFIPPLLGGFLLKIIKKNIPFYYYSTIGTAYYLLFFIFTFKCEDGSEDRIINLIFFENPHICIIKLIIFSTFGGIIALLLNNFWTHRKKIFGFI